MLFGILVSQRGTRENVIARLIKNEHSVIKDTVLRIKK